MDPQVRLRLRTRALGWTCGAGCCRAGWRGGRGRGALRSGAGTLLLLQAMAPQVVTRGCFAIRQSMPRLHRLPHPARLVHRLLPNLTPPHIDPGPRRPNQHKRVCGQPGARAVG